MDDNGLVEMLTSTFGGAAATVFGAMMGRLMWHTSEVRKQNRKFFGAELLWELPVALGMGVLGEGLAEYLNLGDTGRVACVVFMAYLGPRGLEVVLSNRFPKTPKK